MSPPNSTSPPPSSEAAAATTTTTVDDSNNGIKIDAAANNNDATSSSSAAAANVQQHGTPTDGMTCLCTMEDITVDNYVEYLSYPSLKWQGALYEKSVVEQLLQTQFHDFVNRVKTTDCQAELKRLLQKGPPVFIEDQHAMPLANKRPENAKDTTTASTTNNTATNNCQTYDTHILKLWYACDPDTTKSAKLDGALEGEEREKLWEELRQFIIVEGKEEGDDDESDDNHKEK